MTLPDKETSMSEEKDFIPGSSDARPRARPEKRRSTGGFTPGPWSHHIDIACKCGLISAKDHPVAKVTAGDWGDDYPSIRPLGGSIEGRFEAYIEQITYGHVPQEVADANARLIAAAPDLLAALRMCVQRIERPNLSPDANVVLERANAAIQKAQPTEAAPKASPPGASEAKHREAK